MTATKEGLPARQTGAQVPPPDPAETPGIDSIVAAIGKRKKRALGDVEVEEAEVTPRRKPAKKKTTKRKSASKKRSPAKKKASRKTAKKARPAPPDERPTAEDEGELPPEELNSSEPPAVAEDGVDEIGTWTCPQTHAEYALHSGQAQLPDGTPVLIVKRGFTLLYPDSQPRLKEGGLVPADDPLLQWDLGNGRPWSERHKLAPATAEDFELNGGRVHPTRSPGAFSIFQELGYDKVTYMPTGAAAMEQRRAKVKAGKVAQRAAKRAHRTALPGNRLAGDDASVPDEV